MKNYLCLPILVSDNVTSYPDCCIVPIDAITLGLKYLLDQAKSLKAVWPDFQHLEVAFNHAIWAKLDGEVADFDIFQAENPLGDWAHEYNQDGMTGSPLDGFSVQIEGPGFLEFRCYFADTGEYVWSETVQVQVRQLADRFLIQFGPQVYDTLTGETRDNHCPACGQDSASLTTCTNCGHL
jgi:hypothetical protein